MHSSTALRSTSSVVYLHPARNARCVVKAQKAVTETPPRLAPQEQQSLQSVLSTVGLSNSSLNSQQMPDRVSEQILNTIQQGVKKGVDDLVQLEGAMLLAEQLYHAESTKQHNASAGSGAKLLSTAIAQEVDVWQPVFASSGGFPRLLYIPVPEYFDMHRAVPDATVISISSSASMDISSSSSRDITLGGQHPGTINIITELGPFTTHFLGTCSWLTDTEFEYNINKIRIDFAGQSITFPMPVKLENVLTFFLVTPELACARSQLGGTMLLQANPEQGKRYFSSW